LAKCCRAEKYYEVFPSSGKYPFELKEVEPESNSGAVYKLGVYKNKYFTNSKLFIKFFSDYPEYS